ncbi:MAG: hypothetical protein RIF39_18745 [Cyclobacteriaceae bacterium]
MINSSGHQTIEKSSESVSQRLKLGPVKSTSFDSSGQPKQKPPFASDGYYFWEDNIDAAEWWGLVHYVRRKKQYRIFKLDIDLLYDGSFIDLIGNRQHLKLMAALIKKTRMRIDCTDWKFHQFITYFRRLEARQKGIFPFKMIRFNDSKLNPKIHEPLALIDHEKQQNNVLLNPFYIICVFELADLKLDTFTFIK